MNFKWLKIPKSNETKEVQAVELWRVDWYSRYNQYSSGIQKECEFFPNKKDAQDFKIDLDSDFKLIRHTSHTKVYISNVEEK